MTLEQHCMRTAIISIVSLFVAASAAGAQELRPFSVDVTLGGGAGVGGGELRERGGLGFDAVAVRVGASGRNTLVLGASAGFQGFWSSDDMCVPGSRGQCLEDFPSFSTLVLLAGWERGSPGATVRALAGPAFVRIGGDIEQSGSTAGLQGRVDLATPQLGPVALVASVRATAVPRFRGRTLATWAVGLGLRLR